MAAKNAIKDVARVYGVAPSEANAITKTIPNKPGITIESALQEFPEFVSIIKNNQIYEKVVRIAQKIEGLPRQTGVHACFDENTFVRTETGMTRISDIKIGDKVLTDKGRFKKVINTMVTESDDIYEIYPSSSTPIVVTGNHPFLVKGKGVSAPKWIPVEEMVIGDYVCIFDGDMLRNWLPIEKIEFLNSGIRKMYNLTVEDDHTYTANGVIVHNCGICIGQKTIDEYCPTARVKDDDGEYFMTTQFEGPEAEEVGLVKFDFLGLRTLDAEDIALELIRENNPDFNMSPDDIPINDIQSYLALKEGKTDGVFQFESDGMTGLVKQMFSDVEPTDNEEKGEEYFERLTAAVALYRPGPEFYTGI